jgi:hypothetical protein
MIGAARFGSSSRKTIRVFEAPVARAASTNSFSRSESTCPRTIRAMNIQLVNEITKMTTPTPGWIAPPRQPPSPSWAPTVHAEASPAASRRYGIASRTSTLREIRVSVQPRK